jgi:hypothetical protein
MEIPSASTHQRGGRTKRRLRIGAIGGLVLAVVAGYGTSVALHADAATTVAGGGDLGPNVVVFDPGMGSAAINARLDSIFAQQESNQFGTQRYELMFKPGAYDGVNANIGFYTSIAGLGRNPDDVALNNSTMTVDAGWFGGNATQNFWRSAENFSITPPSTQAFERWAVAQAAPMRRLDVHTHLSLTPTGFGWASGGYIADTKIDGQLQPFSQQQWFTRNSSIQMNLNAVWNNVFVGVDGAPGNTFPTPPQTTIASAPTVREKPYLYLDGANYAVWVPSLRTNATVPRGRTPRARRSPSPSSTSPTPATARRPSTPPSTKG